MNEGVIVAATHHVEWLLPWWWYNYKLHNDRPVAFFDFGMTDEAKKWCRQRGDLIVPEIPNRFVFGKEKVEPSVAKKWEQTHGNGLWDVRLQWFKKPFAFTHSPFEKTLWIDLDCEVRNSLSPYFSYCDNDAGLALAKEHDILQRGFQALKFTLPGEIVYNSGVVVFQKTAPILTSWLKEILERNHCYIGDQEALSRLLFLQKSRFQVLPPEYNWDRGLGPNSNALIFHWHGQKGKQMIQDQIHALASLGFIDELVIE